MHTYMHAYKIFVISNKKIFDFGFLFGNSGMVPPHKGCKDSEGGEWGHDCLTTGCPPCRWEEGGLYE